MTVRECFNLRAQVEEVISERGFLLRWQEQEGVSQVEGVLSDSLPYHLTPCPSAWKSEVLQAERGGVSRSGGRGGPHILGHRSTPSTYASPLAPPLARQPALPPLHIRLVLLHRDTSPTTYFLLVLLLVALGVYERRVILCVQPD